MKRASNNKQQVYLDLFGGAGHTCHFVRKQGYGCINFEILKGAHFDLTNHRILKLIRGWISSHVVAGVILATPCTSWSRAWAS